MWTPWASLTGWSRKNHEHAVENARLAAVACSRARVERIEVELYVADWRPCVRGGPRPDVGAQRRPDSLSR